METARGVRIRPATAADAPALAVLAGELGYASPAVEVAERLGSLPPGDSVLVAELQGRVAAWIRFGERRGLLSEPRAEILGLVVGESERGHGLGRALVATVEEWALERGLGAVQVRSATHRDGAHAFYSALGYAETKRQAVFLKRRTG